MDPINAQNEEERVQSTKINPEYENLVPELSDHDFQSLKSIIEDNDAHIPIFINPKGEILDGDHRYIVSTTLRCCESILLLSEVLLPILAPELQSALVVEEEYFTSNVIFEDTVVGFIPERRVKLDAFLVDTIREEPGSSQEVTKRMSA